MTYNKNNNSAAQNLRIPDLVSFIVCTKSRLSGTTAFFCKGHKGCLGGVEANTLSVLCLTKCLSVIVFSLRSKQGLLSPVFILCSRV